jgi:hypothetical protein
MLGQSDCLFVSAGSNINIYLDHCNVSASYDAVALLNSNDNQVKLWARDTIFSAIGPFPGSVNTNCVNTTQAFEAWDCSFISRSTGQANWATGIICQWHGRATLHNCGFDISNGSGGTSYDLVDGNGIIGLMNYSGGIYIEGGTTTATNNWSWRTSGTKVYYIDAAPTSQGDLSGVYVITGHIQGTSKFIPTITPNTGAGVSATAAVSISPISTDLSGKITLVTGSSGTTANSIQCTLSFSSASGGYNDDVAIALSPANSESATSHVYAVSVGSGSGFTINSSAVALTANTTYVFNYIVIGTT